MGESDPRFLRKKGGSFHHRSYQISIAMLHVVSGAHLSYTKIAAQIARQE